MQVTVAADTQVPAPAVPRIPVDQLILAVHPVRRVVDLDVGPPVFEPAGHNDGPAQRRRCLAHRAVARKRLRRIRQPKGPVIQSLQVQRKPIRPSNPCHPFLAASLDRPFRLTLRPLPQRLRELYAGNPRKHWRVLDLHRLRPVRPPPPPAHLARVQQQHVPHLVRRAHRRLRAPRPGADHEHVENLAHPTRPRGAASLPQVVGFGAHSSAPVISSIIFIVRTASSSVGAGNDTGSPVWTARKKALDSPGNPGFNRRSSPVRLKRIGSRPARTSVHELNRSPGADDVGADVKTAVAVRASYQWPVPFGPK